MKILIFSPYYPPHIGGLESHADEFNRYLSQKGANIIVFTPRLPENSLEFETKYNEVKIIRFPAFEMIPNYPLPKLWSLKFWKLFLRLFRKDFDITISRTRFFSTSLLALIYSKVKKIKWIHIEHGSDFVSLNNPFFSKIARVYDHTFGKLVLKLSDCNIANSIASADFCRKIYKHKDCEVIYRGVEIERILEINPDVNLKNKYPKDTIITYIGRLIDGKGVSDLLKAIKKVNSDKIKCFIVGDGPQRENLEKLSEALGISDKTFFWGYKINKEAIGILKISDIYINPSYSEGLPSTVIEAALCQKAIIATNAGGTPEIFSNNKGGFLIAPKDIDSLAEKLKIFIHDAMLREKMGRGAFQEVIDKFDWNKNLRKYLEIFSKFTRQ